VILDVLKFWVDFYVSNNCLFFLKKLYSVTPLIMGKESFKGSITTICMLSVFSVSFSCSTVSFQKTISILRLLPCEMIYEGTLSTKLVNTLNEEQQRAWFTYLM